VTSADAIIAPSGAAISSVDAVRSGSPAKCVCATMPDPVTPLAMRTSVALDNMTQPPDLHDILFYRKPAKLAIANAITTQA